MKTQRHEMHIFISLFWEESTYCLKRRYERNNNSEIYAIYKYIFGTNLFTSIANMLYSFTCIGQILMCSIQLRYRAGKHSNKACNGNGTLKTLD